MKLSIIKSISLTFIISTALSLPSFAKINDNNQPQADTSIQEKFNLVQGYWQNKCINRADNTIKTKYQSVEIYLHSQQINKNSLKNMGKIKLFNKRNCLGKFIIKIDNRGNTVYKHQLSSMKVIDKNHIQDKYNKDINFTRITKADYHKVK